MNHFPSRETVERLRKQYPVGTRIELISMDDPYSKLKPGDKGTVSAIDDIGTIFVAWDSGSGLGLAYGEDHFKVAEPDITHNEELGRAVEFIITTSARETTSGNYITCADDIPADVLLPGQFAENISVIAEMLSEYESVLDIEITPDEAIDIVMGLAYCPNYEPSPEEEDEYPDDRVILDPLTKKDESERPSVKPAEEKPSVLNRIRDAQQSPQPHKPKEPGKNKDGIDR